MAKSRLLLIKVAHELFMSLDYWYDRKVAWAAERIASDGDMIQAAAYAV